MEAEIRADSTLQGIFINPQWGFSTALPATQRKIEDTVSNIFTYLTAQAAVARDTPAEYKRINRDILQNCPGPFIYEVRRGDTPNEIANFFYGSRSAWQSIYRANQRVIGNNPNVIRAGQRLVIPRTP